MLLALFYAIIYLGYHFLAANLIYKCDGIAGGSAHNNSKAGNLTVYRTMNENQVLCFFLSCSIKNA